MTTSSKKAHLIKILKVLLNIDDIQVMKYTIESLIEELEDSNIEALNPEDIVNEVSETE